MSASLSLGTLEDPIVAIATAAGRGAVGIIRASGRDLSTLRAALCAAPLLARVAHYGPVRDAQGETIDHGLALYFPAPHSYTGEEVLELQVHGGPIVLQLVLARCLEAGRAMGLRLANPGEFTARAFFNDKLDLAQAEAVADLIDASTEAAARSASRSLAGVFSREINKLAGSIIDLRMLVEATLDFPEEEIDFLERADADGRLSAIRAQLEMVLTRARQGALLREGLRVVLAGAPNVGKSSLLNALAGAELAIVTPIPGTTRDRISQTVQIQGVPVHVTDTAGLRVATDEVERLGIERSWQAIGDADAVLFLHDLSRQHDPMAQAEEVVIAAELARAHTRDPLHVYNKCDLVPTSVTPAHGIAISAQTGVGLQALRSALLKRAGASQLPEGVFIARARHVEALRRTDEHLEEAQQHANQRDAALDLLAEELRLAHQALGEITGQFSADDLLGEIFGRFCIGK